MRLRLGLYPAAAAVVVAVPVGCTVGCIAGTVGIAGHTGSTAGSSGRHPGCMVGNLGSLGNPGSFGSSGSLDRLGSFGTPDILGIPAVWTAETSGISEIVYCLASDYCSTSLNGAGTGG